MKTKSLLICLISFIQFQVVRAANEVSSNPWSHQAKCELMYNVINLKNDHLEDTPRRKQLIDLEYSETSKGYIGEITQLEGDQQTSLHMLFKEKNDSSVIFTLKVNHQFQTGSAVTVSSYSSGVDKYGEAMFSHIYLMIDNPVIVSAMSKGGAAEGLTPLEAAKKLYPQNEKFPWSVTVTCMTSTIRMNE